MTSTIGPMLENCCGCCDNGGCNNKGPMNVVSTNPDCLSVDTSECGVIKLEPVCPPVVVAGDETIEVVTEDCAEGENCSKKYKVYAKCEDELVKACPNDTTPGTLSEKLEAGHAVTLTLNGCDGNTDSSIRVDVDESKLNLDIPPIVIDGGSNLLNIAAGGPDGHTIYISDKEAETYGNMVCIGFEADQDFEVEIDGGGNADTPLFMGEDGHDWSICTGNPKMATREGIKILADGYYRLFGQITVQNNNNRNYYFNLGRGLLRIYGDREALNDKMYLSTAKHGAYGRQVLLEAGSGIDVSNKGEISSGSGSGQTDSGFNGPWMTFNIDTLVDLREGDIITLGYRPQSNNISNPNYHDMGDYSSNPIIGAFKLVGQRDSTTKYRALFGGTLLGCYQLAPKCFQKDKGNEVYESI